MSLSGVLLLAGLLLLSVCALQDQILWQVGQIAETIWNTMHATQGSGDGGGQSSITAPLVPQTLTDIKIVVLEQFQTLVPNDEMHLYEEVHALYTDVARYEKLQESMAQRMKTLLNKNDELEMRLQSLEERLLLDEDSEDRQCALVTPLEEARDLSLKHKVDELQQQLDERESQIKQLPNMVEMQAAVILTEPVGSHESSDVQELRRTSELVSRSCYKDEYDEFEVPIDDFLNQKPSTISEVYKTFSGCDIHPSIAGLEEEISLQDTSSSESSEAIGILQAQLEMYIRCLHRRARSKQ